MEPGGRQCRGIIGTGHSARLRYDSASMPNYESVEAANWQIWVEANSGVVLDVREPNEWELGTLPGATLISQSDLLDRLEELDKSKPVLCVCRSGGRSSNVAVFLSFNGFRVANMEGGMKALGMQD